MATTSSTESGAARGEEFRPRANAGLPPDEVRRLSALSPLRATLSLAQTFALAAVAIAVALRWPRPWIVAAALVAVAGAQHGLAILAHQSAHYRMYQTRWLNDLVGRLCGTPLGVSMLTYRIIHRIHHNHLYEEIDPDLALMAGYPRGRIYLARKLLKDLFGVTTVKNYLYFAGRTVATGTDPQRDDTSSRLRAAAGRDRRLVLGAQLALVALAFASGAWRWYLLLWLLPLATVLQVLLRLRAVCEHGAVPDTSTPLRAARTTLTPPWIRWLLFPHHMNHHIEHHLYPSVPHYRLAECHRQLAASGALDGAEVVPTVGATFRRIFANPSSRSPRCVS